MTAQQNPRPTLDERFQAVGHLSVDVAVKQVLADYAHLDELKEDALRPFKSFELARRKKQDDQAKREQEKVWDAAHPEEAAEKAAKKKRRKRSKGVEDAGSPDTIEPLTTMDKMFFNGESMVVAATAGVSDLRGYIDFIDRKMATLRANKKAANAVLKKLEASDADNLGALAAQDSSVESLVEQMLSES